MSSESTNPAPDQILAIPELCLVLLIGPSGAGKSTFARRHFKPTEVLSSDFFRALVSDDESNQAASRDAFEVLHLVAARRQARGRLTVVDATNLKAAARKPLVELAYQYHIQTVAIVFALPTEQYHLWNRQRLDRVVEAEVIEDHAAALSATLAELPNEHFDEIHVLNSPAAIDQARVVRQRLKVNRRYERGPFDVIGDVHGCFDELRALLEKLGYQITVEAREEGGNRYRVQPPAGRRAVFVGDLVDRGPQCMEVLRLAMDMIDAGTALCVLGNHDDKFLRWLKGHRVRVGHGLAETVAQLEQEPAPFRDRVRAFLERLAPHYVLDRGRLVVAHAGLKRELHGRVCEHARVFALFGDVTGETDAHGLPVRRDWAAHYRARTLVVYGHTPVEQPRWRRATVNIDTGCVFGGQLTALRYPERELVAVPALHKYAEPARPFLSVPPRSGSASGEQQPPAESRGQGTEPPA